jgi:hypothetical protein
LQNDDDDDSIIDKDGGDDEDVGSDAESDEGDKVKVKRIHYTSFGGEC